MWSYANPVKIRFGAGAFGTIAAEAAGRRYAIVTYPEPLFEGLVGRLAEEMGAPALVIEDVAPNPDYPLLREQAAHFAALAEPVEVIVAIGGGSVLDSAKVFAAADGDFARVQRFLERKEGAAELSAIPIIAVPTTAGTGSEVTCWATVWDEATGKKYSLARESLYPEVAVIDPELMLGKPRGLTLSTALDSLSHALESIWNLNANPVSASFAETAAQEVLASLPALLEDLGNLELRTRAAKAALFAGFAFSNTKTALAHNLSYPITLGYGVPHGLACSFTLPAVLGSVSGIGGFREESLQRIFGEDLEAGAERLKGFMQQLGVSVRLQDYGVPDGDWEELVEAAFAGERGRNFVGEKSRFYAAAESLGVV